MPKLQNNKKPKKQTDVLGAMRHSCEHVLTMAMLNLYGDRVMMAMGPATADGFYFDFDTKDGLKISEEDFEKIEAEMRKIIAADLKFTQKTLTVREARNMFSGNRYKQEWLDEIEKKNESPTVYYTGKFVDLCAGPHLESTGKIGPFKLLSVAGAYWHGDEKNKMLTRIYGTCFATQAELDEYLKIQEDAKARDHRKLGRDLDLFVFSDLVGKGLPILTPKGSAFRRVLERFIVDEEIKRGYDHVYSPPLAKVDLYKTSGHYPYYKDTMYPVMKVDEEELILRPMTCPHHFMLFKSRPRSYREMPVRFAEISPQFRYEKSGELTGLIRVRTFILADAHIMTPKKDAKSEIKGVLDLIDYVNQALGLVKGVDYRYRLSLGNRNDTKKYYQDDAAWDEAEAVLREVLTEVKAPFYEAENEAAFYGPKIDVQMKNILGKEDTAFTVQYDFVMPKRFELRFINEQGQEEEPVVVHRASIGCLERTMAFLLEHYGGALPTWMSPVQVKVLPIADRHHDYARKVNDSLKAAGLRTELDDRKETLQSKIRDAQLSKIPYMLIVGDKEMAGMSVAVRSRNSQNQGVVTPDEFITRIKDEIDRKVIG